jgi:hypothetical protein
MSSEKAKSVLSCFGHDRTRRKSANITGAERPSARARTLHTEVPVFTSPWRPRKKKMAWGSAQPLEKAQNGQGESKEIKAFSFDILGPGLARLCWIWLNLDLIWRNT